MNTHDMKSNLTFALVTSILLAVLLTRFAEAELPARLNEVFLLSPKEENFVYSPHGVETAFGMLNEAALGETRAEIEKTFPAISTVQEMKPIDSPELTLSIANSAWLKKDFRIRNEFKSRLREKYGAEIERLDFQDPIADSNVINGWVGNKTEGMIPSLLTPRDINPTLRFILLNAIYFKAKWEIPFDASETQEEQFVKMNGERVEVQMMHNRSTYLVNRKENCDILSAHYQNGKQSIVFVLPNRSESLTSVIASLSLDEIDGTSPGGFTDTRLGVPKFALESSHDVIPALEGMGIRRVFTPEAELSGMSEEATPSNPIIVAKVLQKAKVQLDETGTIAAAATVVMGGIGASFQEPVEPLAFILDRPFAFFIRDEASKRILFMGKITDPSLIPNNNPAIFNRLENESTPVRIIRRWFHVISSWFSRLRLGSLP